MGARSQTLTQGRRNSANSQENDGIQELRGVHASGIWTPDLRSELFQTKILGGLDVLRSKNWAWEKQKSENSKIAEFDKPKTQQRVMLVTQVNDYNY